MKSILKQVIAVISLSILFWQLPPVDANSISSGLTLNSADQTNQVTRLSNALVRLKTMPYDEETYQLTYKTLLFNSHIEDAYQLALMAVSKKPAASSWHEKLAQTATWVGDYNTSMREWLYVARHTTDLNKIKYAASMAQQLGYDQVTAEILKIYLTYQPDSLPESLALARAENQIGHPEQALLILKKINRLRPQRLGYELMATIYQDTDQWEKALVIWQEIDREFGSDMKSIMAQSTIYCSKKQFHQALNVLKQGISVAKKTDKEFWRAMTSLAWMLSDRSLATLGLSHFLHDSSNLFNYIELEKLNNPRQALVDSIKGWNQFHQMIFFTNVLYLATDLKHWNELNHTLLMLTTQELFKAQEDPLFWEALANMYGALGEDNVQKNVLIQGIESHPDMTQLKVNLLFLVINRGELQWVKALLEDGYKHNLLHNPIAWKVYADAFDVLNKFYPALEIYQEHLLQNTDHDQIVIDYAHILEKIKLYQQSYNVWSILWGRSLSALGNQHIVKKNSYRTLSQVAPYFVSGTDQVRLLNTLFVDKPSSEDLVILLNWMVSRHYFELITYFKAFYMNNTLPVWADTNLLLAHNDLPALQKIIEHSHNAWSRADLINAAVRMENTPLAVDLAFAELTDRPMANELYPEFTQYGIANANSIDLVEEYEQFVNIAGPRSKIETAFRLTNSWAIRPMISLWRPHSTDPNTITQVPIHDFFGNIKAEQKIHRGQLVYSLGYRNNLSRFIPAAVHGQYKIASRWTALVKLGYNQENIQNAYLREGGVQDQLNLGLLSNVTRYDSVSGELQGLNYYSQDRHYLADGLIVSGLYEHKFWLSYPDYTLGLFANAYQFNRNGSFGGNVTSLFPQPTSSDQENPNTIANQNAAYYQELIPDNYNEAGFTFSFGNTLSEYTHAWRPNLWASLYYNTLTSISNNVKIGINGSVFGRDSLQIYAERGTAQATKNQTNHRLGMRYMLYY